jgi:hypothetical protein
MDQVKQNGLKLNDELQLLVYAGGVNTACFKKSFTNLKAYINLYRGHTQYFELSKCSKTHLVLTRIVTRNCVDILTVQNVVYVLCTLSKL